MSKLATRIFTSANSLRVITDCKVVSPRSFGITSFGSRTSSLTSRPSQLMATRRISSGWDSIAESVESKGKQLEGTPKKNLYEQSTRSSLNGTSKEILQEVMDELQILANRLRTDRREWINEDRASDLIFLEQQKLFMQDLMKQIGSRYEQVSGSAFVPSPRSSSASSESSQTFMSILHKEVDRLSRKDLQLEMTSYSPDQEYQKLVKLCLTEYIELKGLVERKLEKNSSSLLEDPATRIILEKARLSLGQQIVNLNALGYNEY